MSDRSVMNLGKVISVAGKGGVGKTTISSLIIREICGNGIPVLGIDADPNYNLAERLGVEVTSTIGALREELLKTKDELPPGVSKQDMVEYQIRLALQEEDCFDLLTMGRQEGPGCYCFLNSVLRTFIDALASKYRYVVIDNEAGLEHLSRRTTVASDILFIVCDRGAVSIKAAGRIAMLADEMELSIGRKVLILNRVEDVSTERTQKLSGYSFDSVYNIRPDSTLERLSEEDQPLSTLKNVTPAVEDVRRILSEELKEIDGSILPPSGGS